MLAWLRTSFVQPHAALVHVDVALARLVAFKRACQHGPPLLLSTECPHHGNAPEPVNLKRFLTDDLVLSLYL